MKKIEEFQKKKRGKLIVERCLVAWIWRRRIRKLKNMKRKADELLQRKQNAKKQ